MQPRETERYKQRLLDTRTRLSIETERMSQNLREKAVVAGDLSNLPDHNADRDTEGLDAEIAVERNERNLLVQVEAALGRIEAGTFGRCEDCGQEIARERLEVIPYTPYCVDCSRRQEAGV
jgi:RNA polymerase-binding protein DksA